MSFQDEELLEGDRGVHLDHIPVGRGEEVAHPAEAAELAASDVEFPRFDQIVYRNRQKSQFVRESHDGEQSSRVHSDSVDVLLKFFVVFESFFLVIPNAQAPVVHAGSHEERFPDADGYSADSAVMDGSTQWRAFHFRNQVKVWTPEFRRVDLRLAAGDDQSNVEKQQK